MQVLGKAWRFQKCGEGPMLLRGYIQRQGVHLWLSEEISKKQGLGGLVSSPPRTVNIQPVIGLKVPHAWAWSALYMTILLDI
jgi:hypothetical protein